MAKTALHRPSGLGTGPLLTSLAELLRAWLPRQRWFAGKGRPVTDLSLISTTELYPGCLHLLVRTEHLGPPAHGGPGTPRPTTAINCSSEYGTFCRRVSPTPSSDGRARARWPT